MKNKNNSVETEKQSKTENDKFLIQNEKVNYQTINYDKIDLTEVKAHADLDKPAWEKSFGSAFDGDNLRIDTPYIRFLTDGYIAAIRRKEIEEFYPTLDRFQNSLDEQFSVFELKLIEFQNQIQPGANRFGHSNLISQIENIQQLIETRIREKITFCESYIAQVQSFIDRLNTKISAYVRYLTVGERLNVEVPHFNSDEVIALYKERLADERKL
ncbi:MAG: hypothetical protein LBM13_05740, partial [Candidatus Ancillula sp.]|nr:hypothetical protein [Candidatus Ancillula sp.]